MSQCLLITAYRDFNQLESLVRRYLALCEGGKVFIHVDKNTPSKDYGFLLSEYHDGTQVRIFSKYRISWGSFNHLRAVLFLLKQALKSPGKADFSFIHIVSGADFPIKNDFSVFEEDPHIYMTCSPLRATDLSIQSRYITKHFFTSLGLQSKTYQRINRWISRSFSGRFLQNERIGPFSIKDVYKGMIWASMPMSAAQYVIAFLKRRDGKAFLHGLRSCEIPEEVFFQTVFMNSVLRDRVVCDNLRFTSWVFKNGSIPAVLDMDDYERMKASNSFFCRKVDSVLSKELIQKLGNDSR